MLIYPSLLRNRLFFIISVFNCWLITYTPIGEMMEPWSGISLERPRSCHCLSITYLLLVVSICSHLSLIGHDFLANSPSHVLAHLLATDHHWLPDSSDADDYRSGVAYLGRIQEVPNSHLTVPWIITGHGSH